MEQIDFERLIRNDEKLKDDLSHYIGKKLYYTDSYIKNLFDEAYRRDIINKKYPISQRMGLIIVYEEYLQKGNSKRGSTTLKKMSEVSAVRFHIRQNNKDRFKNLEEAHPEDPCTLYEDNKRKKGQYEKSLRTILLHARWLIECEKAEKSLRSIQHNVHYC